MSTRSKQNQRSQRARMRDALQITERNLSSLIAARYSNHVMMQNWRDMVRIALGDMPYAVETDPSRNALLAAEILAQECICPRCGIRHGRKPTQGDF